MYGSGSCNVVSLQVALTISERVEYDSEPCQILYTATHSEIDAAQVCSRFRVLLKLFRVSSLQALSRRIHYGKFVAEAKFLDEQEKYTALIQARDDQGIMDLLTNEEVEKQVTLRVLTVPQRVF